MLIIGIVNYSGVKKIVSINNNANTSTSLYERQVHIWISVVNGVKLRLHKQCRTLSSIIYWGSNPIFSHGRNMSFPIFTHFFPWKKSIRKEREKYYLFPSLSIYYFSHFFTWEKVGKTHSSHGKMELDPPYIITLRVTVICSFYVR